MFGCITISGRDVVVTENPMSFDREVKIVVDSMEKLDNIIEQCRNIKLKFMEEQQK